jgi:hypothetical protein
MSSAILQAACEMAAIRDAAVKKLKVRCWGGKFGR